MLCGLLELAWGLLYMIPSRGGQVVEKARFDTGPC